MHPISRRFLRQFFALAALAPLGFAPAYGAVEVPVTKVEVKAGVSSKAYCDNDSARCWIADGTSAVIKVYGLGIPNANSVSDGGSTNLTTTLGAGQAGVPGYKEVNISVSSGANRGDRNISVRQKVNNVVTTEWKFKVYVINNGAVSSVSPSSPNDYFKEATVTVSGSSLDHARILLIGHEPKWGFHASGASYPLPAPTVAKVSNSASQVVIKLTWQDLQSRPTVKLQLCDEALPASDYCISVRYGEVQATINGPPRIKSISCSKGDSQTNAARVGEPMIVKFTLDGPARAAGETITWQMIDSANFERTASVANNCAYAAGQKSTFTIAGGNNERQCTLTVKKATGLTAIAQYVEGWMINPNTTAAPYYFRQACYIKQ
jgi:hypothetical protein